MMATGDMTNNLRNLQKALKLVKYEDAYDISGLSKGIPAHFLPIYHYAFTMFSPVVAEKIADMDVELFGKSDLKFMEGVYKVLRDLFGYKPPLTKDQFFSKGFAEKKVIMCAEVINLVHKRHRSLCPKKGASGSFRTNASRDSSACLGPKVGFQRPKTEEWRVEGADSTVSSMVRKKAGGAPSRPNSARTSRPGSTGHDTSQAWKSSSPESEMNNIAVPKTPGILKAKTSAVQVVYVPRAVPVDIEDKPPLDIEDRQSVEALPAAGADHGKVVEVSTQSEQLSQLRAQNSTTHRAVELLMERVTKLEEHIAAIKSDQGQFSHREGTSTDENREMLAAFMSAVNSKIDNVTARLLLAENRVAIVESKILSSYSTAQANGYSEPDQAGRQNTAIAPTPHPKDMMVTSVSPSPIKQAREAETNGHLAGEEVVTPVSMETKKVRSSTPVDKAQGAPLTFTCIDAATQEKAERLEALMKDTDGILKSAGQIAGNIGHGRE